MTANTSWGDEIAVVIVTLAPHRLDRHVDMIVINRGYVELQQSYINDVADWIATRFLPVPRPIQQAT